MSEIQRNNPKIDYVGHDVFAELGFTHAVSAGDTVYISGIAPLKGDTVEQLEVVGTGSMPQQVSYVLRVLDESLTALELDRTNVVSWTVFTTDMPGLAQCAGLFKEWAGDYPPASMWSGVTALILPEMKLELTAIAVR